MSDPLSKAIASTVYRGLGMGPAVLKKEGTPMNHLGDCRIPDSEIGKRYDEISDFEVWDGQRWVHSSEVGNLTYNIELKE